MRQRNLELTRSVSIAPPGVGRCDVRSTSSVESVEGGRAWPRAFSFASRRIPSS